MKLLFDENVSLELPRMLASEYPGSLHVGEVGLRGADDQQIWDYARAQGFAIVSKDSDFRDRSFVEGFPPKVMWLDVGNAGTDWGQRGLTRLAMSLTSTYSVGTCIWGMASISGPRRKPTHDPVSFPSV